MEKDAPDVDTLITQLHDRDLKTPDKQFQAAIALGKIANEKSKPKIGEALIAALNTDHQALTRAHAAQELGRLKDPRAFAPLLKALKDEYQLVRSYAAQALKELVNLEAIPMLLDVLQNDPFYGARAEAAEALGVLCKHYPKDIRATQATLVLKEYQQKEHEREEEKSKRVLREIFVALDQEAREVVDAALDLQREVSDLQGLTKTQKVQLDLAAKRVAEKGQKFSDRVKAAI